LKKAAQKLLVYAGPEAPKRHGPKVSKVFLLLFVHKKKRFLPFLKGILMNTLIARLSEPSTYAGIAAILAGLGYTIPPGIGHDLMLAGLIISGLSAVLLKEGWRRALTTGDAAAAVETAATASKKG
jgi:hypothetical protein